MNYKLDPEALIPQYQLDQFQELIGKLFQCCQERIQYQSERFGLPDAELRCLKLFESERYLTAKGIAHRMNVVKSRVTKIIDGMVRKGMVQRVKDPEDSRITLLSLTSKGQAKLDAINDFLSDVHQEVLNRLVPEQRTIMLSNLEVLKTAMQSVKDMMT
ncbi:MAG: MarR family winged helix-turn-helix transcriptional regulator [Pseudomonadota bacterium]